jgi:polar amino acid transport system substrate-binding protein
VPITSAHRPEPAGVSVGATAQNGQGTGQDCDPTASLRPTGLPSPGQMPAGSTMAKIAERGRLVAGVDQNTFLFGFRNPASGRLEGFDIDMAGQIAKAIFGDASRVQYKVITSTEREDVLKNGDVDIVVRTYTINCARLQNVNFSTVYYTAAQRLLVDKNSPVTGMNQLAGQRVCANGGSTSLSRIAADPAKPIPVAVVNWSDCLVMLQQGQVAAVSTDDTILAGIMAQDPNVKMVGPRLTSEPYGIGIPKGSEDMVRFVNGVLAKSMSDGSWQASYDHWLGGTGDSAQPPQPKYRD